MARHRSFLGALARPRLLLNQLVPAGLWRMAWGDRSRNSTHAKPRLPTVAIYVGTFGHWTETWIYRHAVGLRRYRGVVITDEHVNTDIFHHPYVYKVRPRNYLHHRMRGLEFLLKEGRVPTYLHLKDYHIRRAPERYSAQIVHVHFLSHALSIVDSLNRLSLPVIITAHGFDVNNARVGKRYRCRLARVFETAEKVVAVSEFIKRGLVSIGCPAEKIVRIYLGCPIPMCHATPGKDRKRVRLVCVSSLKPVKGHTFLIEALGVARGAGAEVELTIVGDGEMRTDLAALAKSRGLSGRVKFLGWLPPWRVQQELLKAEICVQHSVRWEYIQHNGQPGLKEEGLPISLVEASAAGLPIVATRSGGIPEICRDGLNGFLVDEKDVQAFADRIVTLARDPSLRAKLGSAGRALVIGEFDSNKQLAKLEALYDAVLRSDCGRPCAS